VAPYILPGILVLFLIIPAGVIITAGISVSSLGTLLYFFACGTLVVIGLNHLFMEYKIVLAGTLLFALMFVIYPPAGDVLYHNPGLFNRR
jgi:hypothetical protein